MIFSVSTVKDTLPRVQKFVRRNLAGGIDHLVVLLDAQQPDVARFLEGHPQVTCIPAAGPRWWHGSRPARLNDRQRANADLVMRRLSRFPWAEWVFHLDGDEVAHVDRDLLDGLPDEVRVVHLRPLEAVSRMQWNDDPTWFKRCLDKEQLTLLTVLGLIGRPRNNLYFRGHVAGKVGVRPGEDVRLGIHRVAGPDGSALPMHRDPALMVLHYESPDGEEFVRKWRELLGSGGSLAHGPVRSATANAIAGLLELGLSKAEATPFLRRIYERTRLDDFETLHELRLLEQHDPDSWTREPEGFPRGAEPEWHGAVEQMRAEPKLPPDVPVDDHAAVAQGSEGDDPSGVD